MWGCYFDLNVLSSYSAVSVCTINLTLGILQASWLFLLCIVEPLTWWYEGPCCSLWVSSWPWCWTYFKCRGTSPSFPLMSSVVSSPQPGGCHLAVAQPQVCEHIPHNEWKKFPSGLFLSLLLRYLKDNRKKRGGRKGEKSPSGIWP